MADPKKEIFSTGIDLAKNRLSNFLANPMTDEDIALIANELSEEHEGYFCWNTTRKSICIWDGSSFICFASQHIISFVRKEDGAYILLENNKRILIE